MIPKPERPDRDRLYEIAAPQEGHFTTAQAGEAAYSPQLLMKHLKSGRIRRVRRGIYRLVHFPAGDHEDLIALWLWSERAGVFSHETALALLDLSDVLPSEVHMTLPAQWASRRLRIPRGLVLHHADVAENERAWVGSVRVTTATRTLVDCAESKVEPRLVRDAFEDGCARGLVDRESVPFVIDYLKQFFSVSRSRSGPRFSSSSARARRPS
ncbi:MAG: type IV toxin-antitoxin system AbiEi family antitoxin domain-containing protein [Planctomycetes bacterium]|nr:type IV toxin-antitoxin system AbiEi family antitoxin domain-containing protein [Planctomycetota bacterium]